MTIAAVAPRAPSSSAISALFWGGLVVGVLDIASAMVSFGLAMGSTPMQILQSVAVGWLGRAAYQGGAATALLGLVTHFFIATAVTAAYYAASRKFPFLLRHALWCGLGYGLLVFAFMQFVVIPLSAVPARPFTMNLPKLITGPLGHPFLVGLPAALIVRKFGLPIARRGGARGVTRGCDFAKLRLVMLEEGQVFAGRYRVRGRIAQGGMGVIYAAEHVATEASVALKVLWPHVLASKAAVDNFQLEARIAARLDSEHIVRVLDAGFDEATRVPYLVMELLRGRTLEALVSESGPLAPPVALAVMRQVAKALDRAHNYVDREGRPSPIVHRDLKPENLFLAARDGGEPIVKVLDFGIAKVLSQSQKLSQELRGTPLYMASEQMGGGPITPRLDVWAFGLITYYLLTGRSYWRVANEPESSILMLFNEVLTAPLESPSERARSMGVTPPWPASFDAWFFACVNRDVGARFALAGQASEALASIFGAPSAHASGGAGLGALGASLASASAASWQPGEPVLARSGPNPSASGSAPTPWPSSGPPAGASPTPWHASGAGAGATPPPWPPSGAGPTPWPSSGSPAGAAGTGPRAIPPTQVMTMPPALASGPAITPAFAARVGETGSAVASARTLPSSPTQAGASNALRWAALGGGVGIGIAAAGALFLIVASRSHDSAEGAAKPKGSEGSSSSFVSPPAPSGATPDSAPAASAAKGSGAPDVAPVASEAGAPSVVASAPPPATSEAGGRGKSTGRPKGGAGTRPGKPSPAEGKDPFYDDR